MNTKEFQTRIVEDIKRQLSGEDVVIDRMKELATAALEVTEHYPEEIPDAEAQRVLCDFREITGASRAKEIAKRDEEELGRIRSSLGLKG